MRDPRRQATQIPNRPTWKWYESVNPSATQSSPTSESMAPLLHQPGDRLIEKIISEEQGRLIAAETIRVDARAAKNTDTSPPGQRNKQVVMEFSLNDVVTWPETVKGECTMNDPQR